MSYVQTYHEASLSVHKKADRHRTGTMRTSGNSIQAKFAQFLFQALR